MSEEDDNQMDLDDEEEDGYDDDDELAHVSSLIKMATSISRYRTKKRKRGRGKRPVEPILYPTEVKDIFRFVTNDGTEKAARIDTDAVRVADEILQRIVTTSVQGMEANAHADRDTLYVRDLETTVRKKFLSSDDQERLVQIVRDARRAVAQK